MKKWLYVQAVFWIDAADEDGNPMKLDDFGPDYVQFRHTIIEAETEAKALDAANQWAQVDAPLTKDPNFRFLRKVKRYFTNDYIVEVVTIPEQTS